MKASAVHPRIIGLGSYLPSRVLSNEDLEKMVETNDEWIFTRTGIRERRIAAEGETSADMGAEAARRCLAQAGCTAEDVDLIIVTTGTPDYLVANTACLIQTRIGARAVPCFDLQAACTGFLYGLSVAKAFVQSGAYARVLLVSTEKVSTYVNYKDRTTCVLFGDGAGAALIAAEGPGLEIGEPLLGADGEAYNLVNMEAGGSKLPTSAATLEAGQHFYKVEGRELFKQAVRRMGTAAESALAESGTPIEAISWFVPHQANERIIDAMATRFNIPQEKVFKTVHKYGNTSSSSIIIALQELKESHPFKVGDQILLVAFGGGLTWGATILKEIA